MMFCYFDLHKVHNPSSDARPISPSIRVLNYRLSVSCELALNDKFRYIVCCAFNVLIITLSMGVVTITNDCC